MDEPRVLSASDLRVGLLAEFERAITDVDIAAFAELSCDRNPLHTNVEYARHTNYGARIVHGAFQVGLVSAMAGMYLPGRDVVVGSFQCRFPAPLFYPARVKVQGEITAWVPESGSGNLRVRVVELSALSLTAEIHVGFSLHESRVAVAATEPAAVASDDEKPVVIVTGASGGLGRGLIASLAETYDVVGIARSLPSSHASPDGVEWVSADIGSGGWEEQVSRALRGRIIRGLVHTAWPTGPQGSLLDVDPEAVGAQVRFGSEVTIRLARFLRAHSDGGSRMVVLGTTAGTLKPVVSMSAYSLGKATLEHTIRLLAPELARSNITINLVSPSFVPVGMNNSKTARVVLTETAKVPLGRLCDPTDVAGAVGFLLSPQAGFITGQNLPLTGGQL
jgi:3-oxoacyl-[acyl-carrier protein] reductase